jgi:peptidoglycan/xylan/chitin deacetylase (PgdA/CDA1 family)
VDPNQREELRRWAGRLGGEGTTREARAAARAIQLLVDDVDRLEHQLADAQRELETREAAEHARERERAEREREEAERERRREERERRRHDEERERRRPAHERRMVAAAAPVATTTLEPAAPAADEADVLAAPAEPPADPPLRPSAPREAAARARPTRIGRPPRRRSQPRSAAAANGSGAAPRLPEALPSQLLTSTRSERRPRRAERIGGPRPALRLPVVPRPGRRTLVAVVAMAVAAAGGGVGFRLLAPELAAAGPPSGALIGATAAEQLVFSVGADAATLAKIRWTIGDEDVTARASVAGGRSLLRGSDLPDGEHEIVAAVAGRLPGTSTRHVWHVSVDKTPPEVVVDPASAKGSPMKPVTLKGSTEGGAIVKAEGEEVTVGEDGAFELTLAEPPPKPVALVATDRHGNSATTEVTIALVPRLPRDPIRSVHVTFHAWAYDGLRNGIMRLIDEGRINSVQLDLKDESGIVGFKSGVPFAKQIGAEQDIYDLEKAIQELHAKGIYVIGRIVAFRDPIHATEAWKRGWRNQVIQAPDGTPYAKYGGFTNFANPVVRKYNIDVALAAAKMGIDDVLFDYIRRPDGPPASMRFPQLQGTAEASIVSFLRESRQALKPYDVFLGASVFGVAATRPHEVAQDIPGMARNSDYIAPMLYPSHWGPGEYDVANPNAQPYDIIFRSLKDFQEQTEGTGARVVPWLQDFTLGHTYGPAEVRAQIKGAKDVGIDEWIMWDPLVTYTVDAYERMPKPKPIVRQQPAQQQAKPAAQQPKQGQDQQGQGQGQGQQAVQPKAQAAAGAVPAGAAAAAAKVKANELGVVPVLMYHQIRADGGGDYDLTPAQFRAELARLHREGYVPIRAVDLVTGTIDVPAGKTPVVMTFDDSTKEQLAWDDKKRPKPNTAIAIMLDFAKKNPGFKPAGTFYVNTFPFAGDSRGPEMLRWLHENGFELGNHTADHVPFNRMSAQEVQKQLAQGKKLIQDAVPDAKVRTMALPLGVMPDPPQLARKGSWNGISYEHAGVMLVGAEPAPSPFSTSFKPGAVPRIRTSPADARDPHMGSSYWLDDLKANPGRRYVSDGDPKTISFPKAKAGELAPRFRDRANAY